MWLAFDDDGEIDHPQEGIYTLSYGEAVNLGYCRPITFHRHEGRFSVRVSDDEEIYVSGNRNVNRIPREPVMKRRSIAHMDRHQPTFSSLYQLNQINDPRSSLYQRLHHHGYNLVSPSHPRQSMWHARSYESGIGKYSNMLKT